MQRVFEVSTPDGRKVRHVGESPERAASRLIAGYELTGEVLGADETLAGGYVIPIKPGESVMSALLKMHGGELLAWLEANGFARKPKKETH